MHVSDRRALVRLTELHMSPVLTPSRFRLQTSRLVRIGKSGSTSPAVLAFNGHLHTSPCMSCGRSELFSQLQRLYGWAKSQHQSCGRRRAGACLSSVVGIKRFHDTESSWRPGMRLIFLSRVTCCDPLVYYFGTRIERIRIPLERVGIRIFSRPLISGH